MPSDAFKKAILRDLPVLFVKIGWAVYYNGTEDVEGNHAYLKEHRGELVGESSAFIQRKHRFHCRIGRGKVSPEELHIVLVATDPDDGLMKVVGIYASSHFENGKASTRYAERIRVGYRLTVEEWQGQGMRRWATRMGASGKEHPRLLRDFDELKKHLLSSTGLPLTETAIANDEDAGFEGELERRWIQHRKRERKFRARKLVQFLKEHGNRLVCEVDGCRFDFRAKYGELGVGFAEVHHKIPLSQAPATGQAVRLSDLAVVCANCHRMIHRDGQCRPLGGLVKNT